MKRKDFKSFVLRNIQKEVILTEKIEDMQIMQNFVYMDKAPHSTLIRYIKLLHKIVWFLWYTFCF